MAISNEFSLIEPRRPSRKIARTPTLLNTIDAALGFRHVARDKMLAQIDRLIDLGQIPELGEHEAIAWVWWQRLVAIGEFSIAFELEGQYEIETNAGTFRPDWIVLPPRPEDGPFPRRPREAVLQVAIEIDGFTTHYATEHQVMHDNARRRQLQRLGWQIVNITNTEIETRAIDALSDVYTIALNRWIWRQE